MNRTKLLEWIASLRKGLPMIISPGLTNYTIAEKADEDMTLYNMDMPYATPMALGVALGRPGTKVVALEGDGSLIAGPGVLTTMARYRPNLTVVAFDNGAYLTTGSGLTPTATAWGADIEQLGRAAGLENSCTVRDLESAKRIVEKAFCEPGPWLVVAKVDRTDRPEQRVRHPLPVYVYEAGLRFRRAATESGSRS